MEYILTTEKLVKNYGKTEVLKEVSIKIPKGAIYGLVGRNGAGKTTSCALSRDFTNRPWEFIP